MFTDNFKQELLRKLIHLSSLWIPILYLNVKTAFMLKILLPLSTMAIMIEILRRFFPAFNNFILSIIGKLMRNTEEKSFTGATYLFISSTLTIAFFDKEIAIFALTILIISDSLSALVGKKIGKIPVAGKTLEGSLAFALSAFLVYYIYINYYFFDLPLIASSFAILAATLAELFSKKLKIDDNFTIPLVISLTLVSL